MRVCSRCETPVEYENVSSGYYAYCPSHDEDLYQFETNWIIKWLILAMAYGDPALVDVTILSKTTKTKCLWLPL
jgi:hypothetical protein